MSENRVLWTALAFVALGLKVCVSVTRPSHGSNPYRYTSTYAPSADERLSKYRTTLQALDEQLAAEAAVDDALEAAVQRRCADSGAALTLEVDVTATSLAALSRETHRALLPRGAWLPAPLVASGLGVTVFEGIDEDRRLCLDANDALLRRVMSTATPSVAPKSLAAGAWAVKTADSSATTALLSTLTLATMPTKGELGAFAPTDKLVTFFDTSSPAAMAAAAKYAAAHADPTGASGCVSVEPLVRKGGSWSTWLPNGQPSTTKAVEAVRVLARECQTNLAAALLRDLVDLRVEGYPNVPFVDDHATSVRALTAKGATLTLALDDDEVQLVAPATEVELIGDASVLSMNWETFLARAGAQLTPITVKGGAVANTFFLKGGLRTVDFEGKDGVRRRAR